MFKNPSVKRIKKAEALRTIWVNTQTPEALTNFLNYLQTWLYALAKATDGRPHDEEDQDFIKRAETLITALRQRKLEIVTL